MAAIWKRELRSYFTSMIGYVYIAFFLVTVGIYFMAYNLSYGFSGFEMVLQAVAFLFIILIPILTMRSMAEDRKQKTDQLLLTSPLSVEKIVLGKYGSILTVFLAGILIISLYPLILTQFGPVDLKITYAAILGFTLMGAAYLAVGLFISALTENQVVSAIVCFIVILLTFLMPGITGLIPSGYKTAVLVFSFLILIMCGICYIMMPNPTVVIMIGILLEGTVLLLSFLKPEIFDHAVSKVFGIVSMTERFDIFAAGILDIQSLIYYLSIILIFLFLTIQSVKKRRWS